MDEQNSFGHPQRSPLQPGGTDNEQYRRSLFVLGGLLVGIVLLGIFCYIVFRVQSAPAEKGLEEAPSVPTAVPTQYIENINMVGKVIWDVPPKTVAPSTERDIKAAFAAYEPKNTDGNRLVVMDIQISTMSANFGAAGMGLRDKNNQPIPADGIEFLLTKTGNSWLILTSGGDSFCNLLRTFPEDMLEPRREYYTGCFPDVSTP